MPSKTAQRRIGRPGALLAVMMGAGWGCAQIVGADFDKPLQTGGTGGGMPSTSSGGTGGAMSSASSGAMSSTSSSGSSSATGSSGSGGGADGGCMPAGTCATTKIYVYLKSDFGACTSSAKDIVMSPGVSDPGNDFREISQFEVFISPDSNTTPLNICKTGMGPGTAHRASLGGAPCVTNDPGVQTLGYVSTTSAPGYEQLDQLSVDSHTAIVLRKSTIPDACCHDSSNCTPVAGYVRTN
jgi:hypothetical protein